MKENVDIIAGIAAMLGALTKAVKKKFSKRETFVNILVAGFLSFGVMGFLAYKLPEYVHDPKLVMCIAYFIGWLANGITDGVEKWLDTFIQSGETYIRNYFENKKQK